MATFKNVGCIKTGAIVFWPNYDFKCSADVFRVGNCIIVRTHPDQVNRGAAQDTREPDLTIASCADGDEFWRPDVGVFVVPESRVRFWTNAGWTEKERTV